MILLKESDLYDRLTNISTLPEISNFFTFIPCVFRICRHILCSNCITGNRDIYVINHCIFRIADGAHGHLVCQCKCTVTRTQNSHFWICVGINDGTAFTFDKCPRIIDEICVEWRTVPFRHLNLYEDIHIFRCAVCYNRIDGYAVSWTNLFGARTDAQIELKDDLFRESRRSALGKKQVRNSIRNDHGRQKESRPQSNRNDLFLQF